MAAGLAARPARIHESRLFRDALRVFDEAAALDPADPLPQITAGELLFAKFNTAEAAESFSAVLQRNPHHPRALVGIARISGTGSGEPVESGPGVEERRDALASALAANPRQPEAVALRSRRLSELGRFAEAAAAAESALADFPAAGPPLAALGAAHFLTGADAALASVEARFRAARPGDPAFDVALAEAAERQRRYRESAERARRALERSPGNAAASRTLGLNLLRLGEMAEGRRVLAEAFRRDPFDALVKNTLDLLDELDGFTVVREGPLRARAARRRGGRARALRSERRHRGARDVSRALPVHPERDDPDRVLRPLGGFFGAHRWK